MAITTYTELKTALVERLGRADFTTTVQEECIALAEAEMQRKLRTLDMETKSAAFSITGEYVSVPADFLAVRDFYVTTPPVRNLLPMSPAEMTDKYQSVVDNTLYYAVVGAQFRFAPPPAATLTATLVYYAKIPALSGSTTSNWLLTAHPDAYLYGSAKHAAIRLKDAEKAQGYEALFKSALADIRDNANRNRWAGPGMATRPG